MSSAKSVLSVGEKKPNKTTMETSNWLRFRLSSRSWIAFVLILLSNFVYAAEELIIDVAQPTTLLLSSGLLVENDPGSKKGALLVCERVHIHGLSRLQHLRKYAHSVKVKVKAVERSGKVRLANAEVCFHSNISLPIGMCPQGQWHKLAQGSWVQSVSPYDNKLLDIRMPGPSLENIEVSIEEEFFFYRIILLVLGIVMWTVAPALSSSVVFYYSSAMAVGIILVILMILFQGMKLLPTGRKGSLAMVMYSSLVGVGSLFLRHLPRLVHSVLVEIGISDDMYNPLMTLLLAFIMLAGAWLGFWVVRKFVLTEEGSIDSSIAVFVAWSIRIFAIFMIAQSSLDRLLAAEALVSGVLLSSIFSSVSRSRSLRRLHRLLFGAPKSKRKISRTRDSIPEDSYDEYLHRTPSSEETELFRRRTQQFPLASCDSPLKARTKSPPSYSSKADIYYSTFHDTPERKKFSKEEWVKFTRDSTKGALEELVSSPDFSKWAMRNAERLTLTPVVDQQQQQRRWFHWF